MRVVPDEEKNFKAGAEANVAYSPDQKELSYDNYVGLKKDKLLRPNRVITKNNRTSFIYLAGRPSDWREKNGSYLGARNHNGVYRDKDEQTIVCRHLAFTWLSHHSRRDRTEGHRGYHRLFASHEAVRLLPFLHENTFDKQRIEMRAHQRAIASVEGKALGQILQQLCVGMKVGEEKYLLLESEKHSMAIVLKCKAEDRLVVKFYDPNETLVHKRAVCRGVEGLSDLALSDFLSRSNINRYFPTHQQMVLLGYKSLDPNKLPALREDWRFERVVSLGTDVLSALSDQLYFAMIYGSAREIPILLDRMIGLSPNQQIEFLRSKDKEGFSGLFVALQEGHSETVRAYCEAVAADVNLTVAQRFDLLQAQRADGIRIPGLLVALCNGHTETVKVYLKAVAAAELELAQRFELLQAKRADDAPGLYMAFQEGYSETVRVYCEAIVADTNLTVDQRFELLQAQRADGTPGLLVALYSGHSETVRAYCEAVAADVNLTAAQRFDLLQAKRADSIPGLYMVLQNGHAKTVQAYLKAIAETELDPTQRFELLQAKKADGTPGLLMALQDGHTEAVKMYLQGIAETELDPTQRFELLQAQRADGTPGLLVALYGGHSETVRAYCEAVAADIGLTDMQRTSLLRAAIRTADDLNTLLSQLLDMDHKRLVLGAVSTDKINHLIDTPEKLLGLLQALHAHEPAHQALAGEFIQAMGRAHLKRLLSESQPAYFSEYKRAILGAYVKMQEFRVNKWGLFSCSRHKKLMSARAHLEDQLPRDEGNSSGLLGEIIRASMLRS